MELMSEQNYQNHGQRVPLFLVALFGMAGALIGSFVNLYQSLGDHQRLYSASLLVVVTACALIFGFLGRSFALKVQDRAIRAEENLRHYVLTGKLLDSRLTPGQIVGLRFASDGEFPALAREAAENGLKLDDIKKKVRNWRADHYRA
jgi:hypothetical protein